MRLDHLLSKEVVCGGGFLAVDLAWAVWVRAGRGCLLSRKAGWLRRRALLCGVVGCLVLGVEDTPAAACWWWWVPPRALVCVGVACCRGSGAVRPGCLARFSAACLWVVGVGVGGLVVNCIVDASILL